MLFGIIPNNVVRFNADSDIPALDGKVIFVTGGKLTPIPLSPPV